ncbi:hypothetical protein RRG08_000879, partial [Elysia crispata]
VAGLEQELRMVPGEVLLVSPGSERMGRLQF